MSSPRTWGCFLVVADYSNVEGVFPTHVGVFPWPSRCICHREGLPHARGGVSEHGWPADAIEKSSPRTWGCFCCFPCCAGNLRVFPTHVGVFPVGSAGVFVVSSLPHARGGVSAFKREVPAERVSSPRTWGCFLSSTAPLKIQRVFPTHVGVFPRTMPPWWTLVGLPHARGGVSHAHLCWPYCFLSSPRTWGCF